MKNSVSVILARLYLYATSASMTYRPFLDSGHTPSEWDDYRERQNKISREKGFATLLDNWRKNGVPGNDIVNLFRAKGIPVPSAMQKVLQDDDTKVSATEVTGRGVTRSAAKAIHKFVSDHMPRL